MDETERPLEVVPPRPDGVEWPLRLTTSTRYAGMDETERPLEVVPPRPDGVQWPLSPTTPHPVCRDA
ncbi:hypothetical protein GCM10027053_17970 [Intrasporangium mesophilum]